MTQERWMPHEQVSALADGQLQGEEFAQALALLADSEDARAHWHACHLVGDVLRSAELAQTAAQDADFVLRLRARLQADGAAAPRALLAAPHVLAQAGAESANGNRWRWAAGLVSLVALVAVGWQLVANPGTSAFAPQFAQVGVPGADASPRMIRDPRLDQLLAAHRQQGGTSALQMPAGFLRNATFEQPAR